MEVSPSEWPAVLHRVEQPRQLVEERDRSEAKDDANKSLYVSQKPSDLDTYLAALKANLRERDRFAAWCS
jgi:hypothetical protein